MLWDIWACLIYALVDSTLLKKAEEFLRMSRLIDLVYFFNNTNS